MGLTVVLPERSDDDISDSLRDLTAAIARAVPDENYGFGLGGENGYGANFENDVFAMRRFYWGECDCGWKELESDWSEKHKHADDCYFVVSRQMIDASPLQAERETALIERGKHSWGSPGERKAQSRVDDVCAQFRDYEQHVYRSLCDKHGIPWNNGWGCAVHCSCDHDRQWKAFLVDHSGHKETCSLELPNFHHKASGSRIKWYKWIGRDNEVEMPEGVDFRAIIAECIASLPLPPPSEES